MSEIENAKQELNRKRREIEEQERRLQEEAEVIGMILESEGVLDILMGSIIRNLKNYKEECTLIHSLSDEEAEALAEPILQNLSDLVYMIRGEEEGADYDYNYSETGGSNQSSA